MAGNYQKVKSIILRLCSDENLHDKIIVVGGTVPYLISKKESNRAHSDIDIIVKKEDMIFIREYLEKENLDTVDSLNFSYNKSRIDYGVDTIIDGITVNFAPYEVAENEIIQRNFLTKQNCGMDALATVTMQGIHANNIIAKENVDGIQISTYNLEMVKVMKEKSKKRKDKIDIKVIEDFGYDQFLYAHLKDALKDMTFKIEPKNKFLKLFIH